jgi:hypothetical protein
MAFDFKNPFEGLPKPVIIGGIVITVAGSGIYLWHRKATTGSFFGSSTPSQPAATTTTSIDPVTGLPVTEDNVVDPVTGMTYLAEAQEYGSVSAAEADVSSYGGTVSGASGTGGTEDTGSVGDGTASVAAGAVSSPAYTSNAAWSQAAQAGLEDVSGGTTYDGTDIGTALGAYLTATPVTPAQASVIKVALAEYGNPPVGSFQIIGIPATQPSPSVKIAVPDIVGEKVDLAGKNLAIAGFKSAWIGNTGDPSNVWVVSKQSPAAGTMAVKGSTVTGTTAKPVVKAAPKPAPKK